VQLSARLDALKATMLLLLLLLLLLLSATPGREFSQGLA
jgi:hypothetical protein